MGRVVLQTFRLSLAAGEVRAVNFYARMLTIIGNSAGADISFGIGELQPVELKAGLQYELPQGEMFDRLLVYNQAVDPTIVEFILSDGAVRDNRFSASSTLDVRDTTARGYLQEIRDQLQGRTDVIAAGRLTVGLAAVAVLSGNSYRSGCEVNADPANTDYIYLYYDNTVASSKWFAKLSPGQGWSCDYYRGDVYAISGTANQYIGRMQC